jgi:methenyltetrahydrofolate cyclohydrolase
VFDVLHVSAAGASRGCAGLFKHAVLVETSSNGATEPYSPRGVSGSCLVDRRVNGIDAYLDRLASADPTPGGGSAATLVGALGAALCAMVARITAGSERHAAMRSEAEAVADAADALRERFRAAQPLDEEAYRRVVDASALPKATDGEKRARTAALQAALAGAAEAPLAAAGLCAEGVALAERANGLGNTHLVSDVECALHFFRAALAGSVANVRINHRFIKDPEVVRAQDERLVAVVKAAYEALDRLLPALP